jgi:hypothetical protein
MWLADLFRERVSEAISCMQSVFHQEQRMGIFPKASRSLDGFREALATRGIWAHQTSEKYPKR